MKRVSKQLEKAREHENKLFLKVLREAHKVMDSIEEIIADKRRAYSEDTAPIFKHYKDNLFAVSDAFLGEFAGWYGGTGESDEEFEEASEWDAHWDEHDSMKVIH